MMRSYLYHADGQLECHVPIERFREALAHADQLLWVDIEDPEDADIECLLEVFGLHPLTVEDCIMPNVRPKLEEFERYLFVVLQGLKRNDSKQLTPTEVDFCLGQNFLVTVRSERMKVLDEECLRVEKKSPIIKRGADFLFYSLADSVVDSYFPILDEIGARVDEIETRLLTDPTQGVLTELVAISKELMILHRVLAPQRETLMRLNRGALPFIQASNAIYFRDVYDHLLRVADLVDSCRAVTTQSMEVHATVVQNRMNEVMKTMTAIATLALPPLVVTSVYGMNIRDLPFHLGPAWIYHTISAMLMLSVPLMYWAFRRYRWL